MDNAEALEEHRLLPLRSFVQQAIASGAFPGAAWGVVQHGSVRALDVAGGHTYEPDSPRITTTTLYDLASVTKVVATTAAAMLLYERGLLELEMPLGDLLPGFVIAGERGRHLVTLRMLLAHASGLPAYAPLFAQYPDAYGLLRACLQLPLTAWPGTRAEYSDIGFILLGKALEVMAGETLDRFCSREIFTPLGMLSTRFRPTVAQRAEIPPTERNQAFGPRRGLDGVLHRVAQDRVQGEVHDENCWVLGGCAGHAGLFAPVSDLLRFAEGVLACLRAGGLAPAGRRLFDPETVRLFTARSGIPAGSSRALGWDTPSGASSSGQHFGSRSAGHLGYTGTSIWIDPDRDLGVVLLTNRTWPTRENQRIREVRPGFHDLVSELL